MKPIHLLYVILIAVAAGLGLGQLVKRPEVSPDRAPPSAAAPTATPAPDVTERPEQEILRDVPLREGAPAFGPRHAKVTIVQWSDFQCPYCAKSAGTIRELREAYPEDVRFEFRHQPLPTHTRALPAAIAAMAAHAQGRFWDYHDKLFEHQRALTDQDLERYAAELGLDLERFRKDLEDPKIETDIVIDAAEGRRLGALGTPTFFINGRMVQGAQGLDTLRLYIDAEIARADALLAAGTKPEALYRALLDSAPNLPPLTVGDAPTLGPADAPVTIIEWSDFECPFCARGTERLREVRARYGDAVRIVFKHQPLPIHRHAQLAAEASLAAHAQGAFWPFHDLLFAHQEDLSRPVLDRFAVQLGLDQKAFAEALDTGRYTEQVRRDALEGLAVGARSTPSFFINGRYLKGARPLEAFTRVIDEELARAKAGPPSAGDTASTGP